MTTASEWIANNPGDVESLSRMLLDVGDDLSIRLWTEIPLWMQKEITQQLTETFAQPYWEDIARTTMGDAEKALRNGLQDGWSVRKIAKEMRDSLGGDQYAKTRALNVARTESGNVLNAGRKVSSDRLKRDLPVLMIVRVWLSVLGTTTRDTHADLDGVPEDPTDGMWLLGGVRIPWPSHIRLPAKDRCQCQCTTVDEFGLGTEESQQLIQDYYDRGGMEEQNDKTTKEKEQNHTQ